MECAPGVIRDGYIGGIGATFSPEPSPNTPKKPPLVRKSFISNNDNDELHRDKQKIRGSSSNWADVETANDTAGDKGITEVYPDGTKSSNINQTDEYNIDYNGLSILPWEDFVSDPRRLNDLFYSETTQKITYDPEEVNVFFRGKNIMPPIVGDISENGKSWSIHVKTMNELRAVRTWLTDRCSVFGVTLEYKENRFSNPVRAPCVLLMDPSKGNLGDALYTVFTKAMDALYAGRRFCIKINLNGCVERWCRRVLLTRCRAVGAKLIITNGAEAGSLEGAGGSSVVCCIACLPIWLVQTGIFKLHRKRAYDDFLVNFDTEDLFLHGTFQDVLDQRQRIFQSMHSGKRSVFRTQTLVDTNSRTMEDIGSYKFVCVKKCKSKDDNEEGPTVAEHEITTFQSIGARQREKVINRGISKTRELKNLDDLGKNRGQGSGSSKKRVRFAISDTKSKIVEENLQRNAPKHAETNSAKDIDIPKLADLDETSDVGGKECTYADGTGSLFANNFNYTSPSPVNDEIKRDTKMSKSSEEETMLQVFRLEPSDDSSSEPSDSAQEEPKQGVNSRASLTDEMRKIAKDLPPTKSAKAKYKAKAIEKLASNDSVETAQKDKTRHKGKLNGKPTVKKALKELVKTTEKQTVLPSQSDKRYMQAKSKLAGGKKKVENDKKKREYGEMQQPCGTDAEQSPHSPTAVGSATEIESMHHKSDSSDKDWSRNANTCNGIVLRRKSQTKAIASIPQDSSSYGDDVEMFYQSTGPGGNTHIAAYGQSQEMENTKVAFSQKHSKGSYTRCKTGDFIFQTEFDFHFPRRRSLAAGSSPTDVVAEGLYSNNVITVGGTKKSVNTTDLSKGKLETDAEVMKLDRKGEMTPTYGTKQQHQIENSLQERQSGCSTATKLGKPPSDSTRKYLGTSLAKGKKQKHRVSRQK